ncbi:MAG: agenet domain-containing protein [Pyrinomonadaceae bacterium]
MKRTMRLHFSALLCLLMLAGAVAPAFAQDELKEGEEVVITTLAGQECNGVVASAQSIVSPVLYSVTWTCSDGSQNSAGFYRAAIRRPSEDYPALAFKVGDKVEVGNGDKGTVTEIRPGGYKILYDGKGYELWSAAHEVRSPPGAAKPGNNRSNGSAANARNANPPVATNNNRRSNSPVRSQPATTASAAQECGQVGGKIEVLSGSVWYGATILEAGGGTYKIRYDKFSSTYDERVTPDRIRPRGSTTSCGDAKTKYADNLDFFVGTWRVTIYGGISTTERGDKIYREYSLNSSTRPPLVINADGTYAWADRDGKPVRGRWRQMTAQEDPYFGGQSGIVLLRAVSGVDWNVKYKGVRDLKDEISIASTAGSWDGERMGASKGKPAYTKQEYAVGDAVIVNYGGEECDATVIEIITHQAETLYRVDFKCRNTSNTGNFAPSRVRRR